MEMLLGTLWIRCAAPRNLGRPLSVCEPCLGLGALNELGNIGGFTLDSDAYEIDASMKSYYDNAGLRVNVGAKGDLLKVDLVDLASSEGACGGPPCQHVNQSGEKRGAADPRSEVFEVFTSWLIELAWRGCLIWFALENSANIIHVRISPSESYAQAFVDKLTIGIPFMHVCTNTANLAPVLPHQRVRWRLRGLREPVNIYHFSIKYPPWVRLVKQIAMQINFYISNSFHI